MLRVENALSAATRAHDAPVKKSQNSLLAIARAASQLIILRDVATGIVTLTVVFALGVLLRGALTFTL